MIHLLHLISHDFQSIPSIVLYLRAHTETEKEQLDILKLEVVSVNEN